MGGDNDEEVTWSPDSRYLLYSYLQPACPKGATGVSLLTMDIQSGKRAIVKDSECRVNGYRRVGWVSDAAVKNGSPGLRPPQ